MNSIVVVGAGREGKGFLGEVFSSSGWTVSFLDTDAGVIGDLRENGEYAVRLFTTNGVRTQRVSGYQAFVADETYACEPVVVEADVIALCVYPEGIGAVARYLGRCLDERAERRPDAPLAILACTNKNHILPEVLSAFRSSIAEGNRSWFDGAVDVRDTIVRRSVGAETNRSLELEAQVFLSLLIQSPLSVDLSGVEWMELTDNLELLKEVKLYTYNAPHAACAYAGYLAGYRTIGESMQDPAIAARSSAVLDEAIAGVSAEFDIDVDELRRFSTLPALKEDIVDYIGRVAYDPIRKLAGDERLVGVARFCLNHSIHPTAAIESIVDALHYSEPTDPNAVRLQQLIERDGIGVTLSAVSGLPLDHELIGLVVEADTARSVAA